MGAKDRDGRDRQPTLAARVSELAIRGVDPRSVLIRTAIDPAKPTKPCPVCGFPTVVVSVGDPPSICTKCRAQMLLQGAAEPKEE